MAASSAVPGVVDSTKPKSYPVILSDALLGKTQREAITAIRYNHRPTLSSDFAPNSAEIKPSSSSSSADGTFDLSFYENGGKYAFNGTRTTKENQYVLLFDPERKAFVLHRLDSMFNMNVTRTPTNNDADDLREKHPHIDGNTKASTVEKKGVTKAPTTAAGKAKENKKGPAGAASSSSKKKDMAPPPKAEPPPPAESKSKQPSSSSQQAAAAEKEKEKKKRNRSPVESEEDDDDDGGLLIEYPDPAPVGPLRQDFSPAFPTTIRRFSEFVNDEKSESDEDADAEYDEDEILGEQEDVSGMGGDGFNLPNPVGGPNSLINNGAGSGVNYNSNSGIVNFVIPEDDDDDDLGELEKELEKELGMDVDSESSVSEED
ncbi:hypothetical protein VM1G_08964 [Cytospora mali]|uniref:Transcription elongation factor Eaf N-terminal domain-containing protein n=1 Tax=Cytospora mali TaxID=578113 RepID=A0A194W9M0_CYTMA|nr:hypothetical protein VM1G_08964 [Valsa mali]